MKMRKNLLSLLSVACAMCLFTACENDDDAQFTVPSGPVTYKSGEGLMFTSNGEIVDNAQVTYIPDEVNNYLGEITVALIDNARAESLQVLPGSTSVTFAVELEDAMDKFVFSGNGETDYCTFDYDGSIQQSSMSLNFTNINIKDVDIPGYKATFTDASGLVMTYNGNPLLGKQVVVVTEPGLTSAKLVMSGETLDISELMGMIPSSRADESDMDALMNLPTCGVIPGSVTNELTVELNSDNEFNGSGETEFVTFSYDGKITEESLVFNITDATLKDSSLAGSKWEIYNEPNPWYDPEDPSAGAAVTYNGVHVLWESEKKVELFPGSEMQVGELVTLALAFVSIEGPDGTPASIHNLLGMALKDITFLADGNITATYLDTATGAYSASPVNLAQYVVTGAGELRLFLNPSAIIANVINHGGKSRSVDTMSILMNVAQDVVPCLVNGFPVVYGTDKTGYYENMEYFALGTEFLKPVLNAVSPIFSDEEFIQMVMEAMSSDPVFGSMASMMEPVLRDLPEIIEKTTAIEVGINVVRLQ